MTKNYRPQKQWKVFEINILFGYFSIGTCYAIAWVPDSNMMEDALHFKF